MRAREKASRRDEQRKPETDADANLIVALDIAKSSDKRGADCHLQREPHHDRESVDDAPLTSLLVQDHITAFVSSSELGLDPCLPISVLVRLPILRLKLLATEGMIDLGLDTIETVFPCDDHPGSLSFEPLSLPKDTSIKQDDVSSILHIGELELDAAQRLLERHGPLIDSQMKVSGETIERYRCTGTLPLITQVRCGQVLFRAADACFREHSSPGARGGSLQTYNKVMQPLAPFIDSAEVLGAASLPDWKIFRPDSHGDHLFRMVIADAAALASKIRASLGDLDGSVAALETAMRHLEW